MVFKKRKFLFTTILTSTALTCISISYAATYKTQSKTASSLGISFANMKPAVDDSFSKNVCFEVDFSDGSDVTHYHYMVVGLDDGIFSNTDYVKLTNKGYSVDGIKARGWVTNGSNSSSKTSWVEADENSTKVSVKHTSSNVVYYMQFMHP